MPPSFVASITTTLILLPFLLVGTFSAIANSNGMLERTEEESPSLVPRSSLSDFSDNSKNSSNHHHRKRHYNHQRHRNTGDEKPVAMWHDHLNEIRSEDEQEEERQQSDDPSVSTGISGTPQSFFVSNANITKGQRYFNFFFRNATTTTTTMTEWKIVSTKSELSETEDGGDYDDLVSRVTSTIPQIYDDKQPDSNEQGDVVVSSSSPPQPIITVTTVFLVFLFSVLLILTVIGNSLVCLSLIFVKKLRKPQNYLIASLAVSDLFVAVFVMPVAIVLEVYEGQWPFNGELCDFWVSADVLCCTASILNLCGISVDRYRAITTPLEYSSKTTPRRMLAVIFVVWLGSACVSLPPVLLLGNVHSDNHGNSFCSVSQNFWYQIYATMVSFYVPLCVMVVVYVKILRVVSDKKKQMGWKPPSNHKSVHRNTSPSIATNYTSTASIRGSVGVTTSLVNTCPSGGGGPSMTPSSTPAHHHQHPLVTRALVTNSVGGSPVTITTIVSGSSATSSPIRRGSLTRGSLGAGPLVGEDPNATHSSSTNNNKKDSTASQNSGVITPLLVKSNGGTVTSGLGSPVRNNKYNSNNNKKPQRSRHQERVDSRNSINLQQHSQQNGSRGNAVTYFFTGSTIHRIKKEKLFGGLKEHKASTTLGIIMSAFVICWLPFFVLALIRPFLAINGIEIPPWMYTLFNWLGYVNSALNPVIYATLNRDFRKPFREILCLRCSTLDDMMRREFYHQQYGDDTENYNRRISRPHTENEAMASMDGPTNV